MKITIKRLVGLAAVYGVIKYIRANGGPEQAFAAIKEKAKGFLDSTMGMAKNVATDNKFATNVGRGPTTSVADENLH